MTAIEIYPSNLPGDPLERHEVAGGSLHDWLAAKCPSYTPGPEQPVSASVAGVVIPPEQWGDLVLAGQTVEIRPNPKDPVTALWVVGGLLVGAVVVSALMRPSTPSYKGMGTQGQELLAADLKANTPRLNGVIPEIAGRFRVYPDYLCQPRRYFPSPTKQAIDVMLCIGRGEFLIDPTEINIGETDLEVLGSAVTYAIYAPGASVAGHQAHRNWYNAPEVGSSVASAGLRLTAGGTGTAKATASSYRLDGNSITIPTGAGVAPQDWEVGHVVAIVAKTRAITIVDGGGTGWTPNRDKVRGSFGDLGLVVGDQLLISGTPSDDGRYKITTLTQSVSQPGSASKIVGTRVAALQFQPQSYTNLFNKNTATVGYYMAPSGSAAPNATYDYSDYIAVTPGQTYRVIGSGYRFTTYYNASLAVVTGGSDNPGTTFTVPAGVAFVRITIWHSELNTVAMEWTAQPLTSAVTFYVNSYAVTLNQSYADAAALVTAINAQIAGAVASQSVGVVTITESSPYSGQPIALSGYFEQVLGAAPSSTTGTLTQSYDELTLDKWVSQETGSYDENGNPTYTEGWEKAASMTAGTFYGVEVQQPRVKTVTSDAGWGTTTTTTYGPTEYRITALITGAIPGGTGVVGWNFQRLNPDGTNDTSWTGFYSDVTTSLVSIEFDGSQVVGGWLGPFRATPEGEVANLIEFDIFAPMGVGHVNRESGNVEARTKYFEVQWRTNGGAWNGATYSVSGQSRDQLGFTFAIDVPDGSTNIDVRICRIGAEDKSLEALDRLEWYGLKSLLPSVTSYAGVTTMAVTLEGSDKISSKSENQINLLVTRKLNGGATRSIADWVRYVCTSIGYASTDLNESELTALASTWATRSDWFDHVTLDQTTVKDALAMALRAGFAELTIDAGKIRPVRDQIRTTFEHLYTPQNMTSPLRRQFTSYDPDDYDGVDVEFTNAASWEQEVVQCRLPGDSGIRVEKIRLEGVTDRTRAWRIGMRQRRAQLYRRKNYSWATEWDAMNSRYLSYCAVSDDVPGYGQSALLVGFANVTGGVVLQSSEPLNWSLNKFDKNTATVGYYLAPSGVATPSAVYDYSDFIEVVPGDSYTVTGGGYRFTTYYSADKTVLGGGSDNPGTAFTPPAGAAFVRITFSHNELNTIAVQQAANKFNKNTATVGYYLAPSGSATPSTTYDYSDFIAVSPGTTYHINGTGYRFVTFYNAGQNVVAGGLDSQGLPANLFTVPAGVAFVRITIGHAEIQSCVVQSGTNIVALRRPDGTLSGPHVALRLDDYRVQIPGALDFTPITGGATEATHLLLGSVKRWSYPVLITEISPSGDSVEVSAMNYDARIYADDDNTPTA